MFENEYVLDVDIKRKFTAVIPTFVQNDTASLVFRIFDNGEEFDLSRYTRAEMATIRKDGKVVIGLADIENADGRQQIRYEYMGNEMSQEGFAETSLTIFSDIDRVTIRPFKIYIVADIRDAIGASEDYGVLQELIVEVTEALNRAEEGESSRESNEVVRVQEELNRKAAEEDREESESKRNAEEESRKSSEVTRESQELARVSEELSRQDGESERESNETQREEGESSREENESKRREREQERESSEDIRVSSEISREESEIVRKTSEQERVDSEEVREKNEESRKTSEQERVDSEEVREKNEESRKDSEIVRKTSEQERVDSEEVRKQEELSRNSSEEEREKSEARRQENTERALEGVEVATNSATEAASRANKVADNHKHVGDYEGSTTYFPGNEVRMNGSSFVALKETIGNSPPSAQDRSNEWWEMRAQRGVDGQGAVASINGLFPDPDGNVELGDIDGGAF